MKERPLGDVHHPATVARMGRLRHSGKLLRNLARFAGENKIYWIVPLFLVLGLLGFVIATSQAATPFIYSLW